MFREVTISENIRTRKVYRLTDTGSQALKEKLKNILSEPEHIRWQFDIAISNLNLPDRVQVVDCLEKYRRQLLENIKGYADLEKFLKNDKCPDYRMGLAQRTVFLMPGELSWIDGFTKTVESWDNNALEKC